MNLHKSLADHRIYQHRIEKLSERYSDSGFIAGSSDSGVSTISLSFKSKKFAKLIAKAVKRSDYQSEPARIRKIDVEGKTREFFSLSLTDTIVHGAVSDVVERAIAPVLSDNLYSYRKGISWWTPSSRFAKYARQYLRQNVNPKNRGIFVLRRDIDSYTDSIPVGNDSRLWQMIRSAFEAIDTRGSIRDADWSLVQTVVRPQAYRKIGYVFSMLRGVPTGQPISCVIFNLYLSEVDLALSKIPGAYYARYCDDILFAHPDANVAWEAGAFLNESLNELGLRFNTDKGKTLFLNPAARGSEDWSEAIGASSVEYVGLQISSSGTISLSRKKVRNLLRDLRTRALRTAKAIDTTDTNVMGRLVCRTVNKALDPDQNPLQQRTASVLRRAVTDRAQLSQLDYSIARLILEAVTGNSDVRQFRHVPYRKLRQEWGLVSLLHSRNRWGRN